MLLSQDAAMSSNGSLVEQSAGEHPVAAAPSAQADHAVYQAPNFANHSQPAPEGSGVNKSSLPHGYNHAQVPQIESDIHPELRSGLDPPAPIPAYPPVPNMIPPGTGVPHPNQQVPMQGPPQAVAPAPGHLDAADTPEGRKAKRELSQSKRAAQNRAAQRAFRQRKEGYIKKLEQQVRDYSEMEVSFKALETENYALRDYVHRLQSRLLDTQGDYPQPPPGINLAHSNPQTQSPHANQEVTQNAGVAPPAVSPLEVAAQAVAGLNRSEHLAVRDSYPAVRDDDVRTAEEITRQLQADGGPDGLPTAPM